MTLPGHHSAERVCDLDRLGERLTVSRGQILYRQGDRLAKVFCLEQGRFQLSRVIPAGKRLDLETIEPGMFFGQLSLRDNPASDVTAAAIADSLVWALDVTDIGRLVRTRPDVALPMLGALSRRLTLAETRLEEMAYRSVPTRVAAVLLRLSDGGGTARIAITHQELGDMVGALRETVTEVLTEFRAAGLVELGRGWITIRNAGELKDRLNR